MYHSHVLMSGHGLSVHLSTGCPGKGPHLLLCESYCLNSKFHTVHTACDPALHNRSQHNQCRTTYAVIHGLVILMMGMMMPETCWDRSLIINISLVNLVGFLSLHPNACMWDGDLIPMTIFHEVIEIKIYG